MSAGVIFGLVFPYYIYLGSLRKYRESVGNSVSSLLSELKLIIKLISQSIYINALVNLDWDSFQTEISSAFKDIDKGPRLKRNPKHL